MKGALEKVLHKAAFRHFMFKNKNAHALPILGR